jgi:hypothetical protein
MKVFLLFSLLLPLYSHAQGKQFEIFDGQFYNGLFYPLVDIIEWSENKSALPHMEFHIHSKSNPIDLAVVPGERNGRPVLWLMYDLKFRGERVCRHVLAPSHFREGMQLHAYRDASDPDYDNIYVSSEPKSRKNLVAYQMPEYEPCLDANASNKPDSLPRLPASGEVSQQQSAPSSPSPAASAAKGEGRGVRTDYDNHAVPFSF